ncbi:MAG: TerB family tellurite resistance protein [Chloroflexota bacterium]|nr:TerB family tellurite resistance protein [Chloroflexota bacterium]
MVFRRFLGLPAPDEPDREAAPDTSGAAPKGAVGPIGETATVRRIVARLEALPHDQARYLAGFAYVMSRAAQADLDISAEETAVMERSVVELGGIDEAQAVLVVEMAKLQARMQGATEDFLVTREFARIATEEQRLAVLRCCFAVSAADNSISATEASVVNEIARELDLTR